MQGKSSKTSATVYIILSALKSNPKYMSAVGVPSARVLPDAVEAIAKTNKEGFKQGMAVTKKENGKYSSIRCSSFSAPIFPLSFKSRSNRPFQIQNCVGEIV